MRKTLKKYFIPHKENDHRPHFLRWEATMAVAGIILFCEIVFLAGVGFGVSGFRLFGEILSNVLVEQTNAQRVTHDLSSLTASAVLEEAAQMKADDMAAKGYFAHTSPEGITPWYWFSEAGYGFSYAGENLAVNFVDSRDVTNAWMSSPKHRDNILGANFTEIGIATSRGVYEGREAVFVVQMFGRPTRAVAAQTEAPTAPPPVTVVQKSEEQPLPQETFVAVKGTENQEPESADVGSQINQIPVGEKVSGGTLPVKVAASAAAAPRRTLVALYIALAAIITIALLLKVFIRIRIQHPALIFNGVLMLLLIVSALTINQYLALAQARVF
jgi:hypothetical protein